MLSAFKALRRRGVEKVIGSTPRDWTLDPPGSYIELHVRPRTAPEAKPWRDFEDGKLDATGVNDAYIEGAARAASVEVGGGFRPGRRNPASEAAFASGFRQHLKKSLRSTRVSPEDARKEIQQGLDLAREHLIVGVYLCKTDEPPFDFAPLMAACEHAPAGPDFDRAKRAYDEACSPANLLMRSAEPIERREMTTEELDELFRAEVATLEPGSEAMILPSDWSPFFGVGGRRTLSEALYRVISDLASYAAEGDAIAKAGEVGAVKKAPTSGQSEPPSQATDTDNLRRLTPKSSPPGSADPVEESTGPAAVATARS